MVSDMTNDRLTMVIKEWCDKDDQKTLLCGDDDFIVAGHEDDFCETRNYVYWHLSCLSKWLFS